MDGGLPDGQPGACNRELPAPARADRGIAAAARAEDAEHRPDRRTPPPRPTASDPPAPPRTTMETIQHAPQVARGDTAARSDALRSTGGPQPHAGGEFLTFRLGSEEYGIDILKVQEIRSYEQPTRIANAPSFIKGVVNLRGVIVPIVDLRLKLGCDSAEYNAFTVVIVLNVKGRVVGAVVDSVSDVLELSRDAIKPAPEMSSAVDTTFITGIGAVRSGDEQRMLILMDIEALMSSADMGLIESFVH
jgi:purine-binding chemotaxis protein CheW